MTTDIVKVTEEFDEEGRLTRRTVTEYKEPFATGGYITKPYPKIRMGEVWPYGQILGCDNAEFTVHYDSDTTKLREG